MLNSVQTGYCGTGIQRTGHELFLKIHLVLQDECLIDKDATARAEAELGAMENCISKADR
jgi:hypothetical protein